MSSQSRDAGPLQGPAPDRVAIETPAGSIATGDVVDVVYTADAAESIRRWYVVAIDDATFRVPAEDAEAVAPDMNGL
jgi:hypothetical protein